MALYYFIDEEPENVEEGVDYKTNINPDSLSVKKCYIEPYLKDVKSGEKFQFERVGYYCVDKESTSEKIVFNRTVTLKGASYK